MVKTIHLCLQGAAFIFAVVSLLAVFDFHNHKNMKNITSLHSWIGMVIVILFGLQVRSSNNILCRMNVDVSSSSCAALGRVESTLLPVH